MRRFLTALAVCGLMLSVAPVQGGAKAPLRTARNFVYQDINPRSDTHGQLLELRDLYSQRGVVLNFLASWCAWCWKELPELQQIHVDRVAPVVGIAADEHGPPDDLLRLLDGTDVTIPVLLVPKEEIALVERFYDHNMLPSTYIIDRKGAIRRVFEGRAPHKLLLNEIRVGIGSSPKR